MWHMKSPDTCGACHSTVLKDWADESVHGALWKEGKDGPVCVDCHVKEHEVQDPTTAAEREAMPNECGNCHEEDARDLPRQLPRQGHRARLVAVRDVLGLPHAAPEPAGERPAVEHPPRQPEATCGSCHPKEGQRVGFMTFDPHVNPHDEATLPQLRFIYFFMTGLLLGVFAFFGIHLLLWLQRALVGKLRGEFKSGHGGPGPVRAALQPRPDLAARLDRGELPAARRSPACRSSSRRRRGPTR